MAFRLETKEEGYLDIHFSLPEKKGEVLRPIVEAVRLPEQEARNLAEGILRALEAETAAAPD